ncbi:MAG: ROK family protein [Cytophagales bacterium]|uniref:ROK family protein n=1 Tax=Algoriphagus taiwanensis TaxID=1445656 RepID=A0ABQ6Q0D5_9BACT|nr:MAG: ROK family protein [Cytophagales bacterium]GMQ32980.1 ROK family protein [Algoriphagus taiwanensis]
MNVLVIDIGGSNIKLLATGQPERIKIPSGSDFKPEDLIPLVKDATKDWPYEAISIGFPGVVKHGVIAADPVNMGKGWMGYDFQKAFGMPVRIINDAAMQALGSYEGGKLLFMGFGTGLGTAMVFKDLILPLEGGHLPFKQGTFETHVGNAAMKKVGKKKWKELVYQTIEHFRHCFQPDEIVLGGGNSKYLEEIPDKCRLGSNKNAFTGGFRLWEREFKI